MALRIQRFLNTYLRGIADGQHPAADRAEARELLARLGAPAAESTKPRYARHAKAAKKGARK